MASGGAFRRHVVRGVVFAAALARGVPCVRAQTAPLRPVDPMVADTGPLSVSARRLPADLRVPTGFDQVYRVPGGGGGDLFARMNGGITAVFPRSTYAPAGSGGALVEIPPGTVFYIGGLPSRFAPAPPRAAQASRRVDLSALRPARPFVPRGRRDHAAKGADEDHTPDLGTVRDPGVFDDETFRARRIADLLDVAAQAGQAPAGDGAK